MGMTMGNISIREGRVCIIKTEDLTSVKEGMDQIKKALIDCTHVEGSEASRLDTFLFVDLSMFNIINSSVIGVFGSILMNPTIQMLGLCGLQPPVKEILTKFGVLKDSGSDEFIAHDDVRNNMNKVVTFDSIEQGLVYLSPA